MLIAKTELLPALAIDQFIANKRSWSNCLLASIWRENMQRYLSAKTITANYPTQFLSKEKYKREFSRKIEASVLKIIQILFTKRAALTIRQNEPIASQF